MTSLESNVERALEAARLELEPSSLDRERVRAAFGARLAALAVVASDFPEGVPDAEHALPAAGNSLGFFAKLKATGASGLVAAGVLVGAGAGAGYVAGRHDARSTAEVVTAMTAPTRAAEESHPVPDPPRALALGSAAVDPPVSKSAPSGARTAVEIAPPPLLPSGDAFEDEVSLMRRVERALRAKNPQLARALLAEMDQRVPRGALLEERAAARVLAGCLEDGDRGRATAERFLRERPRSLYGSRVRSLCGIAPPAETAATESEAPDTNRFEGDTR
jgi:hypothetical protein